MSQKIKLCYIITRMIAGGAQRIVLDLIRHVDPKVFDIYLIAGTETGKEGSLWRELDILLPEDHIFPCPSLVRNVSIIRDVVAYFHIKKILKKIQPDIVHTHTSKAGIQGRLAAHHLNVPRIIHSTHGLIYSTEANIPNVSGRKLLVGTFKKVERFVGYKSHQLITLSEKETGDAMALNLAPRESIKNIANGVDLSPYTAIPHEDGQWGKKNIRLGIAGRLNKEKGHEVLLLCMKTLLQKYPDIHLYIAGEGPLLNKLKKATQKLGIADHVTFSGYQSNMAYFLSKIDIFVLSSFYEGFGLVLVEAMAAGLPVVATDVGGVREVVEDGSTGLIVPAGSQSDLVMGIEYLLQNPELARDFGKKGRNRALAEFSISTMVKAHEQLYTANKVKVEIIEPPKDFSAIDLHMHTHYSFDSKTQIEDVFERAIECGVQAIAITDHDTIEGALKAKACAPRELKVIPGIEITSDVGDIIGLFVNQPIRSRHYKEAIAEIKAQGGIVYLPHPFRGRRSISLELIELVDVIEVFNGRSQGISLEDDQFGNQDIVNFAKSYHKTGVGGSDAHKAHEVARVQTYVPKFSNDDELKNILLSRKIFPIKSEGEWVKESTESLEMKSA